VAVAEDNVAVRALIGRSKIAGYLAALVRLALACLFIAQVAFADDANATWKPEYADASPEVRAWYQNAQLTDAAERRFGFRSCCAHSDVVKTEFRVSRVNNGDQWYWFDHDHWNLIPSDIIHWGESAPDGQPTLFAIGDIPTCFYPGVGGL